MSRKVPCLHFFPSDHIADTLHLSLEAQGCYVLILFHTWNRNCEAFKENELVKLLHITPKKWQKIKTEIAPLFELEEGLFKQKRLEKTWKEALRRSEKAREAAEIRHQRRRNYNAISVATALPKQY